MRRDGFLRSLTATSSYHFSLCYCARSSSPASGPGRKRPVFVLIRRTIPQQKSSIILIMRTKNPPPGPRPGAVFASPKASSGWLALGMWRGRRLRPILGRRLRLLQLRQAAPVKVCSRWAPSSSVRLPRSCRCTPPYSSRSVSRSRLVIRQSPGWPALAKWLSRALRPSARSAPIIGPGGYCSGSTPSSTSKVRVVATACASFNPLSQGERLGLY